MPDVRGHGRGRRTPRRHRLRAATVSDTVAGLALIASGVGILWAAGAYVQSRTRVRMWMRFKLRHAGRWRWWHSLMLPVVYPRAELIVAYGLSVAAIAAGIVVLL